MKLRNKKTGKIKEFVLFNGKNELQGGATLAELNAEWEDYKPQEPLIKAERVRKIVRAWAEINAICEVIYAERKDGSLCDFTDYGIDDTCIEFVGWIPTLKDGENYTIAELCGEEEYEA